MRLVVSGLMLCMLNEIRAQENPTNTGLYKSGVSFRSMYIEYYDSENYDRNIQLIIANLEQGYYVFRNISINGGGHIMLTNGHRTEIGNRGEENTAANVFGFGVSGLLRIDLITYAGNGLFIDGGYGLLLTSADFPPGGTRWNFTTRYGSGISITVKPDLNIRAGVRHIHISNGKGIGHPRNPAYDGNGAYVGLIYAF